MMYLERAGARDIESVRAHRSSGCSLVKVMELFVLWLQELLVRKIYSLLGGVADSSTLGM